MKGETQGYTKEELAKQLQELHELQSEAQARYERELNMRHDMLEYYASYYRMNLSSGFVEEAYSKYYDVSKLMMPMRSEELVKSEILNDVYDEDKPKVIAALDMHKMLTNYKNGKIEEHIRYRRWTPDKGLRWLQGTITKTKRATSDDIIAFFVAKDVDDEVKKFRAIDNIIHEEIENVAIYNIADKTLRVLLGKLNETQEQTDNKFVVNELFIRHLLTEVVPEDLDQLLEFLDVETVEERLFYRNVLQTTFRRSYLDGSIRRKKIRIMYLDESKKDVIVVRRDITDLYNEEQRQKAKLQAAIEEAQVANRAKTNFLSRMSHDMRTPLNGILNYALFIAEAKSLEEAKDYGEKINVSGKYLETLINDTLGLGRIESGKVVLKREPYIYAEFEPSIRNVVEQRAISKGVNIRFIPPSNIQQYVMFDKTRLQQIFVNLLNNAVKFTPSGGIVELKTELLEQTEHQELVRFTVTDTGIGMSPAFLTNGLFKPFAQENPGQDNEETGTGLGLSIVKQLVELMGGTITCQSTQGEGTIFVVEFRVETLTKHKAQQTVSAQHLNIAELQGKRILLCEDHPLNREIAIHLLKKVGCLVDIAVNGEEGVNTFNESSLHYYDIILMDIRMPKMNGLEAAKAIRTLQREDALTVPIIAMTANAFTEDIEKSFAAGMNAHLAKPIEPKKMYATMLKCL